MERDVRDMLERSVARALAGFCFASGAAVAFFTLIGAVVAPIDPWPLDRSVALLVLAPGLVVVGVAAKRHWIRPQRANAAMAGVQLAFLSFLTVVPLALGELPRVPYGFLLIGVTSFVYLSWAWFAPMTAVSVLALVASQAIGIGSLPDFPWIVLACSVGTAAIIIHDQRFRATTRVERLRLDAERRNEALEAARSKLAEAHRIAKIATWEFDADTRRLGVSADFSRVAGFEPLPGETLDVVAERVHVDDRARFIEHVEAAQGPKEDVACDLRLSPRGGALRWVSIRSRPHRGGAVGTLQDITERKAAEIAVRRADRLTGLGTLVAGVAHEINNPLMYIQGSVELIQLRARELEAVAGPGQAEAIRSLVEDANRALRGLQRISTITKGLRQVARPAGGPKTRESPRAILEDILPIVKPRLGSEVELRTDLRSRRSIECNVNEVSQVFLNLLLNAAEAMGEKRGTIRVSTMDEGGSVLICVEDEGTGIAPDAAAKIFTPFFTTKGKGTGLGLSVSHAIVMEHDGELSFESKEGAGTTFRVRFPAADPT